MYLVTGMHRSGTSAVCRILQSLGVDFGPEEDFLPADKWNALGYFERQDVFHINTHIMTGFSQQAKLWFIPWQKRTAIQKLEMLPVKARYLSMPSTRQTAKRAAHLRGDLVALCERHSSLALKDPRFCLLLKNWSEVLIPDKVLFVYRPPGEVARSLKQRENLPLWLGYRFWIFHVGAFLEQIEETGVRVSYVDYSQLFDSAGHTAQAEVLFDFAGRTFDSAQWAQIRTTDLNRTLRHHTPSESIRLPDRVESLAGIIEARLPRS